jgi:hypothetical protein
VRNGEETEGHAISDQQELRGINRGIGGDAVTRSASKKDRIYLKGISPQIRSGLSTGTESVLKA